MIIELGRVIQAQEAVTETNPAKIPLTIIDRSGLPRYSQATIVAAMPPAEAPMLVVKAM